MIAAATLVIVLCVPRVSGAWGLEAHQFIMDQAIGLLPPEIRPFFEAHRAELVERVVDPDTWKTAGFSEDPHHFLDIDWDGFGAYPFAALPRDYSAAVQKFGADRIRQMGLLPWRTEEFHGSLRRAFERYPSAGPFGRFDVIYFSAWLSHYASDANQPLHGVVNYDGQLTGQRGVHVRFEAKLFERYRSRLQIAPRPLPAITDPRGFIFETVTEGTRAVPAILKADADAIGTRDVYDTAYYDAFVTGVRPIMEERLARSIASVAAMITGAWEAAGRPAVPLSPAELIERRRR